MAAIVGTKSYCTEFSGKYKMVVITALLEEASDVISVTAADHGISTVDGIVDVKLTAGADGNCMFLQGSFSGADITIKSFKDGGVAADAWTDTTVTVTVIGH